MSKSMRLYSVLLLVVLLMALFTSNVLAGKKDDTLNVAFTQEITHVDKYYNTTRVGLMLQRLAWDALLFYDQFENKLKPGLATDWKWLDNLTLDFNLRKGVTFHNGASFSADDVVYTLNYIADPKNQVPAKRFSKWIKNVEKLGPYKVRMHLKMPWPSSLQYLAGVLHINPKGTWDKGAAYQNTHPVGTGPYKIVKNELGKTVVLVKNKNYYKGSPKGQPSINKIVIRCIPDYNTQAAELMGGRLDWAYTIPPDMMENFKNHPNLITLSGTSMRVGYMMMDAAGRTGADNPFTKLKVRQAVAHAIDREAIVKELVKGSSKVIHSACNPAQLGCTEQVVKFEFNPAKAKKLLDEAGYPNGFETKLSAYRDFGVTEAIVAYLNAVGIKVQLHKIKYRALRTSWRKSEQPFVHVTWGSSSLADISAFTPVFFNMGPDDFARDEEIADLLKVGDNSVEIAVREKNYHKAVKLIADRAYWLPLYVYNLNYVMSKDVDFPIPSDGLPRLYYTKWK